MSFDHKGEQISECLGFILDIGDELKNFVMKIQNGLQCGRDKGQKEES